MPKCEHGPRITDPGKQNSINRCSRCRGWFEARERRPLGADQFIILVSCNTRTESISTERIAGEANAIRTAEQLCKALKAAHFAGMTIEVVNDRTNESAALLAIE